MNNLPAALLARSVLLKSHADIRMFSPDS